jgi:hypothetical protein
MDASRTTPEVVKCSSYFCKLTYGAFSSAYEEGALIITGDTRYQNVPQRLGLCTKIPLHGGAEDPFEVQELSALVWPIRYRVLTRDGYYVKDGKRVHFTTGAKGLDAKRSASEGLRRATGLLFGVAGIGYRRVAGLRAQLCRVEVSKSSRQRWVCALAKTLPSADEIIRRLNQRLPIHEAHLDEIFPRGTAGFWLPRPPRSATRRRWCRSWSASRRSA